MRKSEISFGLIILLLLGGSILSVFLAIVGIGIPSLLFIYIIVFSLFLILPRYLVKVRVEDVLFFQLTFLIFFTLIFFSININSSFGISKIYMFLYAIGIKFIIISLIDTTPISYCYEKFIRMIGLFSSVTLTVFGVLYLAGFTEAYNSDDARDILIGSRNPIWLSRFSCDLIFITIFAFFIKRNGIVFVVLGIFFGGLIIFFAGARGPALALGITLIYLLLKFTSLRYIVLLLYLVCFFLSICYFLYLDSFIEINPYSISARIQSYMVAIELIKENYFGIGFGEFGFYYFGENIYYYPHNIFLEIFSELGILGFALFLVLIYFVFKSRAKKNIFYYLFIMALINAQFSGDLVGNSNVFVYGFLSCLYRRSRLLYGLPDQYRYLKS